MVEGRCHCGAVGFRTDAALKRLVDCNCSVCRKLGVLWAHVPTESVAVLGEADATISYAYGDKNLAFHSCRVCGCTSHWISLTPGAETMAVNCRLVEPAAVSAFPVRRFDGADTWKFLD